MSLPHVQLIEYMQRVGYRSNIGGICFGIAHMGLQAILSEDLSSFEKHLQDIKEDIANNYRLGSLISEEDIRKNSWMTEDEIQKLTDIRAFCDGVELYVQPDEYTDFFEEDARPYLQDAMKTSPLIDSSKMTEQQGLYQAASFSGVYKEQELTKLLKLLKKMMVNDNNKPIALAISSLGHSICVGYIPNLKQWVFIDANDLPPKRLNEKALAKKIKRSLRNTKKVILTGKIYSTKNNKDSVDNIILAWKNDRIYKRIHTVTPKKARYVNNREETWLHHAACVGDFNLTVDLLKSGSNADARNKEGEPALMLASQRGYIEVVKALIRYGANVAVIDKYCFTALMLSAQNGFLDVLNVLIENGAPVDVGELDGWTALMLAAANGHLGVVNALIAKGANLEKQNCNGMNALIVASQEGHLEVVMALIHHGANVDAVDADGWTALMMAVQNGHLEVANALIAKGANVNMRNNDGNSALMLASPELREAMLKQIETQNKAASRKKITFSNARVEEADLDAPPDVLHNPPRSKP